MTRLMSVPDANPASSVHCGVIMDLADSVRPWPQSGIAAQTL